MRDVGELALELVALAGEHQRRHRAEPGDGGVDGGGVGVRRLLGRAHRAQRLEVGDGGRAVGAWSRPQGYGVHPPGSASATSSGRRRRNARPGGGGCAGHEHLEPTCRGSRLRRPGVPAGRGGRPWPIPGRTRCTSQVRAAGVNPADVKSYARAGRPVDAAAACSATRRPAWWPRWARARPTTRARSPSGDEVIVFRTRGAYAADLVVPDSTLTRKPAGLGWPEAGGLLLAGATASTRWRRPAYARATPCWCTAASGGVGLFAVQLARLRGARVIATAGERNHDLLRELGAEPVGVRRRAARSGPGAGARRRRRRARPGRQRRGAWTSRWPWSPTATGSPASPTSRAVPQEGIKLLGGGPGADAGDELRAAARPELARLAGERHAARARGRDVPPRRRRRRPPSDRHRPHHRQDRPPPVRSRGGWSPTVGRRKAFSTTASSGTIRGSSRRRPRPRRTPRG